MMRLSQLLAILALVACATCSHAVDVDGIAKRDRPILINHPEKPGATFGAYFIKVIEGRPTWAALPSEHFRKVTEGEDNTQTFFAAPPGEYFLSAGDAVIIRVVDESVPPKPQPIPPDDDEEKDDDSDPIPTPPSSLLDLAWVVFVEENQDSAANQAARRVATDLELRTLIEQTFGAKIRVYDEDQPTDPNKPNGETWGDVAGLARPAMILIDENNGKSRPFTTPTTPEAAESIIRENCQR